MADEKTRSGVQDSTTPRPHPALALARQRQEQLLAWQKEDKQRLAELESQLATLKGEHAEQETKNPGLASALASSIAGTEQLLASQRETVALEEQQLADLIALLESAEPVALVE